MSSHGNLTSNSDLFFACWVLSTSCDDCLRSQDACAWCAVSQVCVPNEDFSFPLGILAPIKREDICPLAWRERWEMRSKPFSCRCSTMTLMSVVVAVLSTLFGVLLIWLLVLLGKELWKRWKKRQDGWWKVWQRRPRCWSARRKNQGSRPNFDERQPLLGQP